MLVVVVIVVCYVWRKRRQESEKNDNRQHRRPIAPPESALARYSIHLIPRAIVGATPYSHGRRFAEFSETDDVEAETTFSLYDARQRQPQRHLRYRDSAVYYNNGPFTAMCSQYVPCDPLPPNPDLLYENTKNYVQELYYENYTDQHQRGTRHPTQPSFDDDRLRSDDVHQANRRRPLSLFPQDEPSGIAVGRGRLNRTRDRRSIYPTDPI